jgi:alkyl hydroperoxide reductase subunit AhpF
MDATIEQRRQLIRDGVRTLASPVSLLYYTPDVASASTRAERELLEDVARASDRIRLSVLAERWDATREHAVGIARTPAIVVRGETDPGIRYYGAPDGYELETFLAVIRAVSEGRSGLSEASRARVRQLTEARHLEVLVAPT